MTMEVKKLLQPQGEKWLFMRARAKDIDDGRMDVEVTILNENLELVALSHHICFDIDNAHGPMKRAALGKGKL